MNRISSHFLVVILIVIISLLHYLTPVQNHHLHAIYQRLYYLPVLFVSFRWGLHKGILYSTIATLFYVPHIVIHWQHSSHDMFTQYVEIAMLFIIALLVGVLSDRERQEQYKQQETLKKMANMERLSLLGQLAAGLAHEIRNPLGGLLGSSDIIMKEIPEENKAYPFVEILKKELSRMRDKLNYFLAFSKPRPPKKLPHTIKSVVEAVVPLIEKKLAEKSISLKIKLQDSGNSYLIDSNQLQEILLNLLMNAADIIPTEGEIVVESFEDNSTISMVVEDSGPGIPNEVLPRLFEPFFTTRKEGTGLGLPIVKQLIEAMGGTIFADNSRLGARFTLVLPKEQK